MTGGRPPVDPALEEFARSRVAALGTANQVLRVEPVQFGPDRAVLRLTLARPPRQLVLKVAGPHASPDVDYERTAAVSELARTAGVPVASVLAADTSSASGPWRYLLQDHVAGSDWRRVRPLLAPEEVAAAHREIATAVLALQSIRFPSFGELDARGAPAGVDLPSALRRRAELRVVDERRRDLLLGVLDREAHLLAGVPAATLCHDDLHHGNVIFRADSRGWRLAAFLDWDKAWAGPPESDLARMGFWDDMTGPEFWETYRSAVPAAEGWDERALLYQLLWCLEYDDLGSRHLADTAELCRRLGIRPPG